MGCRLERYALRQGNLERIITHLSSTVGHYKYFKEMAEEENEHANKFMEYQNKRGGTIVLMDIKVSDETRIEDRRDRAI